MGFPGGTSGKEPACKCRRHKTPGVGPWVREISQRRAWQPTPVCLPGNPMNRPTWWATDYNVVKSWSWLKQLSMHAGTKYNNLKYTDNQQGPAVEHMELCSKLCGSLDGRGVWGRMDTCLCMPEALHCSAGTITTLSIGYTPIQKKIWI